MPQNIGTRQARVIPYMFLFFFFEKFPLHVAYRLQQKIAKEKKETTAEAAAGNQKTSCHDKSGHPNLDHTWLLHFFFQKAAASYYTDQNTSTPPLANQTIEKTGNPTGNIAQS